MVQIKPIFTKPRGVPSAISDQSNYTSPIMYTSSSKKGLVDMNKRVSARIQTFKQRFTSDALLVHYDGRLACDASNYGIGAVISHVMNDCQKRPIVWAYTEPYH